MLMTPNVEEINIIVYKYYVQLYDLFMAFFFFSYVYYSHTKIINNENECVKNIDTVVGFVMSFGTYVALKHYYF